MSVEGWVEKKLGQVAEITMGQSPDSKFYSEEEIGMPFLQGCAEFTARFPDARLFCSQPKKIGKAGSILFSVRAPVGRTNIADRDYIIGRGLAAINGREVIQDYLEQFLEISKNEFWNASQGSTFEAINSTELANWGISYPESLTEQTQIAAILSTVDRAIAQTEAIIAKQQRIKTGLMQDLLTRGIDAQGNIRTEATHAFKDSPLGRIPVEWEVEEIKSRASVRGGKRLPMGHSYSESDTGLRYLQTTDFIGKRLNYGGMHFLSPKTFQILERYEIVDGNIFISIAGVNLGVAGVFRPNIPDRTILTENAAKIVLSGDDVSEYAATQINGPLVQTQIASDKGIGAGVPKLALFRIESLLIPWPHPNEQEEILNRLNAVEASLEKEQTLLSKYHQTKTGLMQDLLTGRVRVGGVG
jgi:type I restriction enzyme S subunit